MIIKYYDKEFLVYTESDLKNIFKKFINISTYFNDLIFLLLKTSL